ncbi:hypothetical protein [Jeotgalibacillus proteolyticus]|nr:hypothetical protein [Jeotgalibacillus proteolyticus]
MFIAFLIWIIIIIFALILGTYLCYRIEKHGVKRWGATGSLFKYNPKSEE